MFQNLWNIMYRWFYMWLEWSKKVVELMGSKISDLTDNTVVTSLVGDLSLIEVMFDVGFPVVVVLIIVKFFTTS